MAQRVTLADVAREANVSAMTVSRFVNNKGDLSKQTFQKVKKAIDKLGYRPSGIARSLANGQTFTIGLIVPDIANPYFAGITHGITNVANAAGFSVLLCDCQETANRELTMLDVLEEKQVDGVIIAAPRSPSKDLIPVLTRHANVVVLNRFFNDSDRSTTFGHVSNDDKAGAYNITNYLINQGHTSIGFLAGPRSSYGSSRRLDGYVSALEGHGLTVDQHLIQYCIPTVEGGIEIAEQFLSKNINVTALFCFNDLIAIGALQYCNQRGIRVPADIAIFGYDDIPMASWVAPKISTCRVNFEEMGKVATSLLINYIENAFYHNENIVLSPTLVIRESAP